MNHLDALLATQPLRSGNTVAEPTKNDLLVLDVTTGDYFSLGPVGAFVWERLDGSTSLAEIATQVAKAWGVDQETAKSDVLDFASQLASRGLSVMPAGS